MKVITKTLLATALAVALSNNVLAQSEQNKQMNEEYSSVVRANSEMGYRMRASDILGMDVQNYNGDTIGEVDDLIVTGNEDVAQAVISVGGFLGIGDKLVAVPYSQLQISNDHEYVIYNATEDALKSQPEFTYIEGEVYGRDRYESVFSKTEDAMETTATETAAAVNNAAEKTEETMESAAMETKAAAEDVADDGVWDQIAGNWKQFKGHVKQQWGELTDDELDVIEGKRDVLVGKLQERYGITKEEAEEQVENWTNTL
jgi:uncharacterized protein YjbJ (UPF0337 family)/sporulation protein YlmC with PRC-barrel domain